MPPPSSSSTSSFQIGLVGVFHAGNIDVFVAEQVEGRIGGQQVVGPNCHLCWCCLCYQPWEYWAGYDIVTGCWFIGHP